ncbi:hypothetical protein BH11PAT4_BH11PAT4_6250 [soil metagenome]
MLELLTRPDASAENPYARYGEIYENEKSNLFAFTLDKRDEPDYASAVLGYCGAGGDSNNFSFSIGDLFNNFIAKDDRRRQTSRMREHVADYRNDFSAMLVDVFGSGYQDLLSPTMITKLWDETCDMLARKYNAAPNGL